MRRFLTLVLAALVLFLSPLMASSESARCPVILDTDIGTDIDDTWALAQLLRSPELELKLVVTDTGNTEYRARVAAKFLERVGRTDVPVGVGISFGTGGETEENLHPWVKDYALGKYPGRVHADGVWAMIDCIMTSPQPVTVIAIGAVPNLKEALRREPRIAGKCHLVGMHGSLKVGYGGSPVIAAEANVRENPEALRAVLAAPWKSVLLTPLDTCGVVSLHGEDYRKVWVAMNDPVARNVIESYALFAPRVKWMECDFFTQRSTTLFDCVAVYLAHDTRLVEIEEVRFDITDDGYTRLSPNGVFHVRAAMRWKHQAAFERLVAQRVSGGDSGVLTK